MYTEWTKHIKDPDAKSNFEKKIFSAKEVLDHIKTMIEEREKTLDRQEMNIEIYNMPNWSERQAHKNGQRSSLDWLKKLVDLDQQKKETKYDGNTTQPNEPRIVPNPAIRRLEELSRGIDRTGG